MEEGRGIEVVVEVIITTTGGVVSEDAADVDEAEGEGEGEDIYVMTYRRSWILCCRVGPKVTPSRVDYNLAIVEN